ncbi:unnamed protein product [Auanema sp. JU1783]|nr:unnamed protein product [Auanema sp. JU1783]
MEKAARPSGSPNVTGLSPTEGTPGTQITIRGENLGVDQNDLLMLFICGTDCLHTAKWKSPSKIVARLGHATRGLGDIKIITKSGGRGTSLVKFRVFIAQVGPLEESAVWVDETRTVPGREAIRVIAKADEEVDILGLKPSKKFDQATLQKWFPEGSGNIRMELFSPEWYLLENHADATVDELRKAIQVLEKMQDSDTKKSEELHKANLYALINCVDTLASLHDVLEENNKNRDFDVIQRLAVKISEAKNSAEKVFKDVLSRKDQADVTRNTLSVLTRFKFIFFLPKSITENMKKGEYVTILNDYTRAKALYKDTEVPLFKEVMEHLDSKMEVFKDEMKRKLIDTPASFEEQSKLIKYLKILEPNSDPTWECITAYHCYLEDILWKLQEEHYQKALASNATSNDLRGLVGAEVNERYQFVSNLVKVLLDKLQSFWKLSNSYNTNDERWAQRQEDINQMLINTINVSSWLILNALVANALPDDVLKKYQTQFVPWPQISPPLHRSVLLASLKTVRSFISSLLDSHFTVAHIQPLVELCMTIRLKSVSVIIDKGVENVILLQKKEDWKQELVEQSVSKTSLPDFLENEICDCLSMVKDVLMTTGFFGESCLFSRERFRSTLLDLFVHLVISVRICFDRLLNTKNSHVDLTDDKESKANQGLTKKFLIAACNVDYIIDKTMKTVVRRMNECGVKMVAEIEKKCCDKLNAYRVFLMDCYIKIKCSAYNVLIESADYTLLPDENVSNYAKEIVMCCVLQQAELNLYAPHLSFSCLQMTIKTVFDVLVNHFSTMGHFPEASATQCVIDLCALEEALSSYTTLETRAHLNSFRAQLVGKVDQSKVTPCLTKLRHSMLMALDCLSLSDDEDDLNTSNV